MDGLYTVAAADDDSDDDFDDCIYKASLSL